MSYYCNTNVPMVRQLLGSSCTHVAVEQGIAGSTPGSKPTYIAMGHMYFDKLDDFLSYFGPNAGTIMDDLPNFTNSIPVVQISEEKYEPFHINNKLTQRPGCSVAANSRKV